MRRDTENPVTVNPSHMEPSVSLGINQAKNSKFVAEASSRADQKKDPLNPIEILDAEASDMGTYDDESIDVNLYDYHLRRYFLY